MKTTKQILLGIACIGISYLCVNLIPNGGQTTFAQKWQQVVFGSASLIFGFGGILKIVFELLVLNNDNK
jgi:hypothetical protein